MDREVAQDLYAACAKALASLTEAEHAIHKIADEDERTRLLHALSDAIVKVLGSVRAPVVLQYPDLEPPEPLGVPDAELSQEDQEVVSLLQASDLQSIDAALLGDCASSWRKVARVVGTAMRALQDSHPDIPTGYYAQRVALLVSAGRLESQGNLEYMRFSEVRLVVAAPSAA